MLYVFLLLSKSDTIPWSPNCGQLFFKFFDLISVFSDQSVFWVFINLWLILYILCAVSISKCR